MTYDLLCERHAPDIHISQPEDVFPLIKRYASKKEEHFIVITLDGSQSVIKVHIVSIGILNRTLIHPREVFVRAITDRAASLILCHNHPSGNLEPSEEDKDITRRLCKASSIMGIPILDHLIISKHGFISFKEKGYLPVIP